MATEAPSDSHVAQIGQIAGVIWQILEKEGPLTFAKLVKKVAEPRDNVMQGLGWLARENKVRVVEEGRSRIVSLSQ